MSLIEELRLKELTTANNMLFRLLNERCQQFNNNIQFPNNELIGKSVSPVISTPTDIASPVPLSPLEFNTSSVLINKSTLLSSTANSPISSPSTSSESGVESEDDRRPHKCPDCQKRFRFKSNLFEHKTLHQPSAAFVCPFCSKTCRLKGNLKKHLQVHVSSSEQLEELWKAKFSRSSGRPRKQLPNQQPVNNLHQQQMPIPLATYAQPANISPVMTTPPAIDFRQALFDLNSLLQLNTNQQQILSTAFNRL